jgi:hypothetical protein
MVDGVTVRLETPLSKEEREELICKRALSLINTHFFQNNVESRLFWDVHINAEPFKHGQHVNQGSTFYLYYPWTCSKGDIVVN